MFILLVIYDSSIQYSLSEILSWNLQSARALEYIHSRKYVHRNITSRTMILDYSRRKLKICSFGFCKNVFSPENVELFALHTVNNISENFTDKSDVCLWGLVFYECFSRILLINDPIFTTLGKEVSTNLLLEKKNIPKEIFKLMKQCTRKNVTERLSMSEIVKKIEMFSKQNTSINNMDFEKLFISDKLLKVSIYKFFHL